MSNENENESATESASEEGNDAVFDYDYPDDLLGGDRERGLSKNDRRFLVTGKTRKGSEPAEKTRTNIRSRIRRRIRETIVDFWLAMNYLDEYDRDFIFKSRSPSEDWETREGVKNAIQFFYRGLEDSDLMDFETALESAVHDAEFDRHGGPVHVETEFEVEVDEHFRAGEAYEKFEKGAPLEPTEVGMLLITGRVTDPDEVQRLAQHARGNGLLGSTVSPLAAREMADRLGGDSTEKLYSTATHLPVDDKPPETDSDSPAARPSVRGQDILDWEPPGEDESIATREDLPAGEVGNSEDDDDADTADADGDDGRAESADDVDDDVDV